MLKLFTVLLALSHFSCTKKGPASSQVSDEARRALDGQSGSEGGTSGSYVSLDDKWQPLFVVSQASLDDAKFTVHQFEFGIQDFVGSQSPVITYKLPRDADYVEIMRCLDSADLSSAGTSTMDIRELNKAGLSPVALSNYYQMNDVFYAAQKASGLCTLVSEATSTDSFVDSWAPTGSIFYLIRACVSEKRLVGLNESRYCSRRVAVTDTKPYENKRTQEVQEALHFAELKEAKLNQITAAIRTYADQGAKALDQCAKTEHERAVTTTMRRAFVQLFSIIVEMSMEIYTLKGIMTVKGGFDPGGPFNPANIFKYFIRQGPLLHKQGRTPMGLFNDLNKYMGPYFALQGMITGQTFQDLASSANDYPRSCYDAKKYRDLVTLDLQMFFQAAADYAYYQALALSLATANASANGGTEGE